VITPAAVEKLEFSKMVSISSRETAALSSCEAAMDPDSQRSDGSSYGTWQIELSGPYQELQTLARGGFFYYRTRKELIGLLPAGEKSDPASGWRMAWETDFIGLPLSDDPKDVTA